MLLVLTWKWQNPSYFWMLRESLWVSQVASLMNKRTEALNQMVDLSSHTAKFLPQTDETSDASMMLGWCHILISSLLQWNLRLFHLEKLESALQLHYSCLQ